MGYTWDDRVPFRERGKVGDFTILKKLRRIDFAKVVKSSYAPLRLEKWYNGTEIYTLKDGEVVDFDSKLLHKSTQSSDERFIITFRRVKTEFSKHKLF
jgi:arginine deiminase